MNIDDLMNVEPALEDGIRLILSAEGIIAITRQNAPESFQTERPRVEIKAKVGAATGHRHVTAGGVIQYDTWFFDLALRAVVQPHNVEADNLLANQYIARLRGLASTFGQSTWTDEINFPNHLIVEPLKDMTTDRTLQADDNDEFAILNFSGIVQIRTASWNN
jgi:hypothetical protein